MSARTDRERRAMMTEYWSRKKAAFSFQNNRIRRAHADGLPNWALAERFGLSLEAVVARLERLGLSANPGVDW